MKSIKSILAAVIIISGIFFVTSDAYAGGRIALIVNTPVVETVNVSPGPGFFWIRGHYRFDRFGFRVWVPGHWAR